MLGSWGFLRGEDSEAVFGRGDRRLRCISRCGAARVPLTAIMARSAPRAGAVGANVRSGRLVGVGGDPGMHESCSDNPHASLDPSSITRKTLRSADGPVDHVARSGSAANGTPGLFFALRQPWCPVRGGDGLLGAALGGCRSPGVVLAARRRAATPRPALRHPDPLRGPRTEPSRGPIGVRASGSPCSIRGRPPRRTAGGALRQPRTEPAHVQEPPEAPQSTPRTSPRDRPHRATTAIRVARGSCRWRSVVWAHVRPLGGPAHLAGTAAHRAAPASWRARPGHRAGGLGVCGLVVLGLVGTASGSAGSSSARCARCSRSARWWPPSCGSTAGSPSRRGCCCSPSPGAPASRP